MFTVLFIVLDYSPLVVFTCTVSLAAFPFTCLICNLKLRKKRKFRKNKYSYRKIKIYMLARGGFSDNLTKQNFEKKKLNGNTFLAFGLHDMIW